MPEALGLAFWANIVLIMFNSILRETEGFTDIINDTFHIEVFINIQDALIQQSIPDHPPSWDEHVLTIFNRTVV
jgi:hypothetical protein